MGVLFQRRRLQGKQVKVFCNDGDVLEGRWLDWWEADESDWEDDETPCDSMGLFNVKDYWTPSVEILETEIKDIKEV
jgi:hypothetical protein|nr:MAG TPA: hypothetical protein [Caudoviricetes sp.]